MSELFNLARMTSATSGTGTLTLGSAVTGYLSFADAATQSGRAIDGVTVTYAIADGTDREQGRGVYTAAGTTLTRATVLASTNGGSKISCSGSQQVMITPAAEDFGVTLISSTTTSASATTIAFSSIPQGYKDLIIVFQGRLATAATSDLLLMQMNGDTGANYNNERQIANAGTNTATENLTETSARISDITAATATANFAGQAEIVIANYAGATFCKNWKVTSVLGISDATGNTNIQTRGGLWKATPAAVTAVTLLTSSGGGFVDGCVASLYGRR